MKVKKEKYSELSKGEKNYDEENYINDDSMLNPKEFLIKNDGQKRITKYVYCFALVVFFILGYLLCYIFHFPSKKKINITFLQEIQSVFNETQKVNLNEIEIKLGLSEKIPDEKFKGTIHIAFTLDPGFILETMLTISSILATQKNNIKLVFHLGVINDFKAEYMMKMYELKHRINNLTEFNFYYLKEAMEKMQDFHPKGAACPGKFELPQLISDDIERILLFDAGDVLVLRDLTEFYNYDMGDKWVLGPPEPRGIEFIEQYNRKGYINIGSILLNIKELKKNDFWKNYYLNRNLTCLGAPDQTLFNIMVPDDKKGYFPFRFGSFTNLKDDINSDKLLFENIGYESWLNSNLSKDFPENPKNNTMILAQLYNSVFIHQFTGKWEQGDGLSIYRHLAKYFIILAGIWDELCYKKPGYCV